MSSSANTTIRGGTGSASAASAAAAFRSCRSAIPCSARATQSSRPTSAAVTRSCGETHEYELAACPACRRTKARIGEQSRDTANQLRPPPLGAQEQRLDCVRRPLRLRETAGDDLPAPAPLFWRFSSFRYQRARSCRRVLTEASANARNVRTLASGAPGQDAQPACAPLGERGAQNNGARDRRSYASSMNRMRNSAMRLSPLTPGTYRTSTG